MATGLRLFISYSRVDQAFAVKLSEDLRGHGFTVWIDQDAIPAGANWDVQIEKGVGQSDCVLVILSPASADSPRVRDEVVLAEDEGKTIFPILYQPCKVPFNLRRRQRVDFTASYEKGIERLVADVSAFLAAQVNAANGVEDRPKPRPFISTSHRSSARSSSSVLKGRIVGAGVMMVGVVLMAIVLSVVYGVPSRSGEATGPEPRDSVRQAVPRDEASSTTTGASRWSPGQHHPKHPHVVAGLKENQWVPEEGYAWLDSRGAGDFRVKWMPGVRHRQHPYVFTSQTEGRWSPAPGYKWVNADDPNDLRVTPLSSP
jgi:hypothetical protein